MLCVGGELFKSHTSCLCQRPLLDPASETPHPLVTERGGGPVNYRRIPQSEQWCTHPAALPPHSTADRKFILSDGSSIKNRCLPDQYAITEALGPFKCFPLRGWGLLRYRGSTRLRANAADLKRGSLNELLFWWSHPRQKKKKKMNGSN